MNVNDKVIIKTTTVAAWRGKTATVVKVIAPGVLYQVRLPSGKLWTTDASALELA